MSDQYVLREEAAELLSQKAGRRITPLSIDRWNRRGMLRAAIIDRRATNGRTYKSPMYLRKEVESFTPERQGRPSKQRDELPSLDALQAAVDGLVDLDDISAYIIQHRYLDDNRMTQSAIADKLRV